MGKNSGPKGGGMTHHTSTDRLHLSLPSSMFTHLSPSPFSSYDTQVACFTIPDNKICWLYTVQLSAGSPDERFSNSEWGPEATQAMCDKIRHIKAPFGRTMGDLIDVTPKDSMSKVMLEEKLFQTWYHGRTVLIGDGKDNVCGGFFFSFTNCACS